MINLIRFFVVVIIFLLQGTPTLGQEGQNADAAISIDLNWTSSGNQGVTQLAPQYVGYNVYLEVRVSGASNLDTYEFNLNYPTAGLTYKNAWSDNFPPSSEINFLKTAGGSPLSYIVNTSVSGVVNISYTLEGVSEALSPDGEGLLAVIWFEYKVASPGNLTFGLVKWLDLNGVIDICSDVNKGIATLPVQMTNFMATSNQESGNITLTWHAENEIGNVGYHVWRSEHETKDYERITTSLINGNPGSMSGHEYSFIDKKISHGITYWYKIESISIHGNSEFSGPVSAVGTLPIPDDFGLSQNYPNPFNPETTIEYQLPEDSKVTIRIFNLLGKQIKELVNGFEQAGYLAVIWDGKDFQKNDVSSGIYLIQMQAGKFHEVRKATILR